MFIVFKVHRVPTRTHARTHAPISYAFTSQWKMNKKKNPYIVNHNTCVMRCVHARKQNTNPNERCCCGFFVLIISCETHWYRVVYICFFFCVKKHKNSNEAIEKRRTKKKKQWNLLARVCLTWEAKTKSKKNHIQLLSNAVMAFLNTAKVLMSCDCFIFFFFCDSASHLWFNAFHHQFHCQHHHRRHPSSF